MFAENVRKFLFQMPDDRTVSDMYHLYQQESDIKQSELKAKALKKEIETLYNLSLFQKYPLHDKLHSNRYHLLMFAENVRKFLQQESDIKQSELKAKALKKEIETFERSQQTLKDDIGWNEQLVAFDLIGDYDF
jgi:ribosomal protein L17